MVFVGVKRTLLAILLCIAVGLPCIPQLCSPLHAQPPRGDRERERERDPFFMAVRHVHLQLSPDRELHETLLRYDTVAEAIGLPAEDLKQIQDAIRESIKTTFALREEFKDSNASQDEMSAKIIARLAPFEEKISTILQRADFDRLLGIYVQDRKYRAATNKAVAQRIGLGGDELLALREYRSRVWQRLMDESRDQMRDLIRHNRGEEIPKLFQSAEEKLNAAMSLKLTASQREALEKLKGEPFDFPPKVDFRPPPPPRGPRRGEEPRSPNKDCCPAKR